MMNIAEAKSISLADYLQSVGIIPCKQQGNNLWYYSPFRNETEASFKVNLSRNEWMQTRKDLGMLLLFPEVTAYEYEIDNPELITCNLQPKMIIAVDFDGTLHTGQWPNIGSPAPYAVDSMKKLHDDGHYLILWTCRKGDRLTEAINWMLEKGIPFDRVNDHEPENKAKYGDNTRKVYAHLYIDDKQVGGLPAWPEILDWV